MSTEAAVASAVVRSLKRRSGMIGSTANRASTRIARPRTTRPATTRPMLVAEPQANWLPARETQTSSSETPPTSRVAPA